MNYFFPFGLYVLQNVSITITYPVSNFCMSVTSVHEVLLYMYLTGLDVYLEEETGRRKASNFLAGLFPGAVSPLLVKGYKHSDSFH